MSVIGAVLCLVPLVLKENGCIYIFILAALRLLTGPPPVPFLVLVNFPYGQRRIKEPALVIRRVDSRGKCEKPPAIMGQGLDRATLEIRV